MNWYFKTILSQAAPVGGIADYLGTLGIGQDVLSYILSLDIPTAQFLTNEVRKNPQLTLPEIQQMQLPQKQDPYTIKEKTIAKRFPEIQKWILVNFRKIRISDPNRANDLLSDRNLDTISNKLQEIYDWSQRSIPKPDISSYSFQEALEHSDEWHRMMEGEGEGKAYENIKPELIIYGPQWKNPEWTGWTIQRIESENDLLAEGNKMNNCVGVFCRDVESGDSIIYSLRDPQNHPHVTIEVGGKLGYYPGSIKQIKGNSNQEPDNASKTMIKEWISTEGEKAGINREINTFEELEESHAYESADISNINGAIDSILQGTENEYGLRYVFDSDLETILDDLLSLAKNANQNSRSDDQYYGDITESPPGIVNLALKEDLKLTSWPRHNQEYKDMIINNPKQTDWKHIQEVERWAWKQIDEVQDDFPHYETGLEYPHQENYETPEEYNIAIEEFQEAEADIHDEWLGQSLEGGFAKDLLNEIKDYRKEGIIPGSQELFDIEKKRKEMEIQQNPQLSLATTGSWYKKAQLQETLPYFQEFEEMGDYIPNEQSINNILKNQFDASIVSDIAQGDSGVAYLLSNGDVLKITTNSQEGKVANYFFINPNPHVVKYKLVWKEGDLYYIVMEKIETKVPPGISKVFNYISKLMDVNHCYEPKCSYSIIANDNYIDQLIKPKLLSYLLSLIELPIKLYDFLNVDNIGVKEGELIFFDIT